MEQRETVPLSRSRLLDDTVKPTTGFRDRLGFRSCVAIDVASNQQVFSPPSHQSSIYNFGLYLCPTTSCSYWPPSSSPLLRMPDSTQRQPLGLYPPQAAGKSFWIFFLDLLVEIQLHLQSRSLHLV